jgi:plasmid rolling circle replication initiator protein Rep
MTDKVAGVLDVALKGRRLIGFGGRMAEKHKELNLDDPEKGDLINIDGADEMHEGLENMIMRYFWNAGVGNYVLVKNNNE